MYEPISFVSVLECVFMGFVPMLLYAFFAQRNEVARLLDRVRELEQILNTHGILWRSADDGK